MSRPFTSHRAAALAVLNAEPNPDARLTCKAGSSLGQLVVDRTPLTPSQV